MSVPDSLLAALRVGVDVYDLGRPFFVGMPQSANHPEFWRALPRRHGDTVRPDGGSAANDLISMGTHVGTHIDALAHVSHDGLLFGGTPADEAQRGGRFADHGVHTIAPMFCRGVLLDVPTALGQAQSCPPGYEITAEDLDRTVAAQGITVEPGDVVLIRSGWGRHFEDPDPRTYRGLDSGVPGIGAGGARWLAERRAHAAGADTIAFECLAPGAGHSVLPAHRVLLVENGIYMIEAMNLDVLAGRKTYEFAFVLAPLAIRGGTGSPVRPLAVTARG